jgi:SAM-dependent methyltransferase
MADIEFFQEQYEDDDYYTMSLKNLAAIDTEWGFRWRLVNDVIARRAHGRKLLDVGSGNGYFVKIARDEFGFDAIGIEISEKEIEFARDVVGVDLLARDLMSIDDDFDIITLFNVVEHVSDPIGLLEAALRRLRKGGVIVLTTPSPKAIHVRLNGLQDWAMICPPHHINIFTRLSLEKIRRRFGLEELHYATISTYIRLLRRIEGRRLILRRLAYSILSALGLGADHFVVWRKSD